MTQPRSRRQNWTDSPPRDWGEREAHRVAVEIQRLRGKKSGQWLSDQTAKLGHRVSRAVISDLETGRRRYVTTAELALLAAALNTSPVALMYPDPSDEIANLVEVLPDLQVTGFQASQWFSGMGSGLGDTADGRESARLRAAYRSSTKKLNLWRQIVETRQQSTAVIRALGQETEPNVVETRARLAENFAKREQELIDQLDQETAEDA